MIIKKNLSNAKGSVLIFSLLVLIILSVLGISIVNVTIANFKTNKITGETNAAFYIADGAIEEALSEIKKMTHDAEAAANDWINNPDTVSRIRAEIELDLEGEFISQDDVEKELEKRLQEEFENRYFGYLLGYDEVKIPVEGDSLKSDFIMDLETIEFTPDFNNYKETSKTLTVQEAKYYTSPSKRIEISVVTDGSYNEYDKSIELKVNIIPPEYHYIISSSTIEKEVHLNNIYKDKAISAGGDLIVTGGKVEIGGVEENNGNIYAYGTYPEKVRPGTYQMGGIVSGYEKNWSDDFIVSANNVHFLNRNIDLLSLEDSGNLIVHGDVATRANIKTMAQNSRISIDGNAYCDSLMIESNSSNSTIHVRKNLIMYDDLEINGLNGTVYIGEEGSLINGEIWGVLDGDPAGLYNDRSSSIIINSYEGSEELRANKVFIGGTAYIKAYRYLGESKNEENKKYYQTGESVSLKKYSYIYQNKLPFETYAELVEYEDDEKNKYYLVEITDDESSGSISKAQFKANHFFAYAYENRETFENDDDRNKVKINELSEETLDQNYSLGVITANNKFYNPEYSMSPEVFLYDEIKGRPSKLDALDKNTNLFYRRDYGANKNVDEQFDHLYKEVPNIKTVNETEDKKNFIFIETDKVVEEDDMYKDIFINPPETLDIKAIYGVESKEELENYCTIVNFDEDEEHVIEGIIFTKGNVFIYEEENNELQFNGTIIAKGNVVFYGEGKKNLRYDENKVLTLIAKNEKLYDFFYGNIGKKINITNNSIDYYPDNPENSFDIYTENNDVSRTVIVKEDIPKFEGSNKKKTVRTFEIISWKEIVEGS